MEVPPPKQHTERIRHPAVREAIKEGLRTELQKGPVPVKKLLDTFFPGNEDSSLVKKALLEMKGENEVVVYSTQGGVEMVALRISEVA